MDEYDLIDGLIDRLNDGVSDITFERDALETDRPDDWGAVELTGEERGMWADGKLIDQILTADVWVCTSQHGSRIKRKIQNVLREFAEEHDAGWRLMSRNYIYDLDRIVWRWRVSMWAPLADDADESAEDPDPDPAQADPEEGG